MHKVGITTVTAKCKIQDYGWRYTESEQWGMHTIEINDMSDK